MLKDSLTVVNVPINKKHKKIIIKNEDIIAFIFNQVKRSLVSMGVLFQILCPLSDLKNLPGIIEKINPLNHAIIITREVKTIKTMTANIS